MALKRPGWILLALVLLQLGAMLRYFPPSEVFSGEPAFTSDYPLHYLSSARVADDLRDGRVVGLSLRWGAGIPNGVTAFINSRPFALVFALTPEAAWPLAFNLTILGLCALYPVAIWAAARRLGLEYRATIAATLLALCAWYGSGLFRLYWRGGSVVFASAAAAGLWAAAWAVTAFKREASTGDAMRAGAAVALVAWIHPLAGLVPALVAGCGWFAEIPRSGLRLRSLGILVATVVMLSLPWMLPFLATSEVRGSLEYGVYAAGWRELLHDFGAGTLRLVDRPKAEVSMLAPLLLGAVGTSLLRPSAMPQRRALWAGVGGLALLSYGAASIPGLGVLQPYRYAMPLALVLAVLCAPSVARWAGGRGSRAVALLLLLLIADRLRVAERSGDYIGAGLGDRERSTLEWLRGEGVLGGPRRLLSESDWIAEAPVGRPDRRRVSYAFVGFERDSELEMIGAPLMATAAIGERVSFWRGRLFGRPLEAWSEPEFRDALRRYDVGWVLCLRRRSCEWLRGRSSSLRFKGEHAGFELFEATDAGGKVLRGSGRAWSEGDAIRVEAAVPGTLVLAYNFLPHLRVSPTAELFPVDTGGPMPSLGLRLPLAGGYRIAAGGR